MRSCKVFDCCLFGAGGLLIWMGISLVIAWPFVFDEILTTNLRLSNTSKTYSMWVRTPIPMYLDIYLFNFTNAAEFARDPKNVKPIMEEIGPFVFEEVHERVNVTWNNEEGTVSYNQTRKWTFVPDESLPLNTPITNIDIVSLTVSYVTKSLSAVIRPIVGAELLTKGGLFLTKPANQWLFDGIELPLLNDLEKFEKYFPIKIPIPFDKFGFFYERNMSDAYDGRFKILTGSHELTDLGMLVEWNNRNTTTFFPDSCGVVQGSSGEIFPPTAKDQETFSLFISDVCSALDLKFSRDRSEVGMSGREFVGDESMFSNNASVPSQACYCEGSCMPPGVRNITKCRLGAPVFVSFPHFYLADSSYLEAIDGLSPNKSLHEFRLTIDPLTGIPVDVRAQIQVNALLDDYAGYRLYRHVPRKMIPMLWFSQRVKITPTLASQAVLLSTIHNIGLPIFFVLASIGLLMVVTRFWLKYKMTSQVQDDQEEPIIPEDDS